ncbi:40S ribosomal protein S19 isoform X7 [Cricetulus griseus]|uniref:40S ribosomal protein S19 isoform X7 n=1 Tax=Cricetulus griseus TaxID=10029 RepID=A0A9J7GHY3_CRIGR|nr:40S ribosomal protein S19 isoform X7 [Cricetulus griseus]
MDPVGCFGVLLWHGHRDHHDSTQPLKTKRSIPQCGKSFHSTAPVPPRWCRGRLHDQDLRRTAEKRCQTQPLQQRLQECGPPRPPSPGGAEDGGKGPRWGPQANTSGTERSGQNCRTGGSCQQEALEQRMLG